MFQLANITAGTLERKTVSLTFDDGPGPDTERLSHVLSNEGIRAVFFVTGEHVTKYHGVVDALVRDGHLIGNHTFDHPWLPNIDGRDAVRQVLNTHRLIVEKTQICPFFFRAPWGQWPGQQLVDLLNDERELRQYIGPIYWDADGCDYDYWTNGRSPKDCAENYLNVIRDCGNGGIVLMHDNRHDDSFLENHYNPVELVTDLVPQLRADGYEFVRLDELPLIQRLINKA